MNLFPGKRGGNLVQSWGIHTLKGATDSNHGVNTFRGGGTHTFKGGGGGK